MLWSQLIFFQTSLIVIFYCPIFINIGRHGGLWLVLRTPDKAVRVLPLAGVAVLGSWAKHFTLIVSLST